MRYAEALEEIEEIIKLILKCPFGQCNYSQIFHEEAIELLREVAEKSEINRRKKNVGVIGGSSAGIVGGFLAILGAALTPVTFGASVGLIAAGTAVGAAGAFVSIGFSLDKFFSDKDRGKLVQPTLERFVQFQKNLGTTVALLKVAMDVVRDQRSRHSQMDLTMPLRVRRKLSHIVEDLDHLKKQVEEEDQFDAYEFIKDLSYFAEQLIDSLNEMLRSVRSVLRVRETWYEDEIKQANENPFAILDNNCFEQLQANGDVDGRVFFQFAKRLFEVDPADNSVDKSGVISQTAAATGNVAAKGGVLTSRTALRVAKIGKDAAKGVNVHRIAKGVSAAGIALLSLGVVVDVGFLGHAVYDLVKNEPGEFSSGLITMATVMEKINDLSLFT
ncbi:hypothetical protein HOLleu_26302 [Holothuria leucospilota]|uniref:Uncharacterized protein n=1 Tax=Holothuria leucospilota TaxID=206669 RepID=A0A9Q1BT52_HOLLE|nr:hypothetical protein HOLleu_26302 [Holothuria leucospilota]